MEKSQPMKNSGVSHIHRAFLAVLAGLFVVSCAGPKPAPVPTKPQALATLPWSNILPSNAWFSIQATGRVSPYQSDLIVVYPNGRATYADQSEGKQFESQLDDQGILRWKRMLETNAKIMSLQDSYPRGTPFPVQEDEKGLPQSNDAILYTLTYREGNTVKTVKVNKSGAPEKLVAVLDEFWYFVDEIKSASAGE